MIFDVSSINALRYLFHTFMLSKGRVQVGIYSDYLFGIDLGKLTIC